MSITPKTSELNIGSIVAGTYSIVGLLGKGGMGAVWEAHHTRLPGKRVAIKVLHASVAHDTETLARFKREAEIACRLDHPNIVEVHDFNKHEDGSPYLILELLQGTTLDARLREGALDVPSCEAIVRQIGSALQCAHAQGVIHRDLKPQNIFLLPSPSGVGPEIVKVLDFGISKIRGSSTVMTQDSTLLGTPQYMAPEQATGDHASVDARTDIFSLGGMIYELLSARPAFEGQNIPEVVYKVVHVKEEPLAQLLPSLEASKSDAIHRALAKAQDDRFTTVDEFVLAFTGQALPPLPLSKSSEARHPEGNVTRQIGDGSTIDSSKLDIASANTIDSSKLDIASANTINEASSSADEIRTTPTALRAFAVVAAATLTIGGGALLLRGGETQPTSELPKQTERAPASGNRPVATSAKTLDAGPGHPLAGLFAGLPDAGTRGEIHAHTRPQRSSSTKAPRRTAKPEMPHSLPIQLPPQVEALLITAQAQLAAGQLSDAIANAKAANRKQVSKRAYVLQAKAFCRQEDVAAFGGVLRSLPKLRARRLRRWCAKNSEAD